MRYISYTLVLPAVLIHALIALSAALENIQTQPQCILGVTVQNYNKKSERFASAGQAAV